jgi:hypothetical protein
VSLEGVGSGSGLLDLTRESDDTSLGAELLDEIAPGGTKRGSKAGSAAMVASGSGVGSAVGGSAGGSAGAIGGSSVAAAVAARARTGAGPIYVEQRDPMSTAFGGAALAAALMVLFGGFALISAILGTRPAMLQQLDQMSMLVLAGIGVGVTLVFFITGAIVGRR